jgi:hypothetical protein
VERHAGLWIEIAFERKFLTLIKSNGGGELAGGGDKSDRVPRSSRSPSSNKAKGGGGASADGSDDACDLAFDTNVYSPDPAVVAKCTKGQALRIKLDGKVVAVIVPSLNGDRLGTLAGHPDLAQLVKCLQNNQKYEGKILKINGGNVDISVWRVP